MKTVVTKDEARQGHTTGRMRRILGVSLALTIVGLIAVVATA